MSSEEIAYVNGNQKMGAVQEIWESVGGDLWFITEDVAEDAPMAFGYARLKVMPQRAEWGTIDRKKLLNDPEISRIGESNWMKVNTYENGLVVKVED